MLTTKMKKFEFKQRRRNIDDEDEEVRVQAEEKDVDNEDEEVQGEEEEFPEDTPERRSIVTTSNVNNREPRVDITQLPDLGMISPPQSLDEQEEDEQQDNSDDDDSIQLTVTKEEEIKFVKNNFGVITRFLRSEECNYLKKETSLAKGSVGSFLIGTGISEELNEAIKDTINKMGKANKCFNLILNNAHAVYVYTVLKMFNELEVPKGNCVKNKSIIKLMNHIFPNKSVPKVIEKGQKETSKIREISINKIKENRDQS